MTTPIIIDTDPGIDDALAIMLAFASPEIEVLGLTSVGGNVGIEHTTRNALDLLALVGRTDVPVGMGAARPLVARSSESAEEVHGSNGLGGVPLPRSPIPADRRGAVELLRDLVEGSPEPVTVVPIGPLTNIALLHGAYPETYAKIGRIVLMGGGAIRLGNTTPTAEFNIWFDPEAAARVFAAGVPITMVGLDVTQKSVVSPSAWECLRGGGPIAQAVLGMVAHYAGFYEKWTGSPDTAQHDSLAVAAVFRPDLLTTRRLFVDVECAGTLTRGMTVVQFHQSEKGSPLPPNVDVALDVDVPGFTDLLISRIAALDTARR
ncbi:MAG: nucleoside hydrolase [Actinobacteria bacterium]|nr:nucleoside hydrolase [Actinomycetota bacterium]